MKTMTIGPEVRVPAAGSLFAGKYRIEGELGRGGMGVVFKAEDVHLRRPVALKFLPTELARRPEARERFLREARAAAALDHPHIDTIYEAGEADGLAYIAMAFVEGRTLADRIAQGPVPVDEALDLAAQIADGLAEAHQKGIFHRDIKSSNIMITAKGQAKIMDFGLAKVSGDTDLTQDAGAMGTISYMSPEQARGESMDGRTDIWSLGVVMYEMLAGRLPFESDHPQAVIHAILHEEPKPLRKIRPDIPEGLSNMVAKALIKKPADRTPSADDMIADLNRLKAGVTIAGPPPVWRRRLAALAAGTGLLIVAAGAIALLSSKAQGKVYDTIAVMPFTMTGVDPGGDDISDGLTDEIIKKLFQIEALRVKATAAVLPYKKNPKPIAETGRELGVKALLTGRVTRSGGRLRIAVELIDTKTETVLWPNSYEGDASDYLTLQSSLVQDIARNVRVRLTPDERARLAKSQKVSPEAYEKYLQSVRIALYEPFSMAATERGIALVKEAIALDPDYARFHAFLGGWYVQAWFGGFLTFQQIGDLMKEEIRATVRLDPESADSYYVRSFEHFFAYRWKDYLGSLGKAVELAPGDIVFRWDFASNLAYLGDFDRAIEEYRRIQAIDPGFDPDSDKLAVIFGYARRYDEVLGLSLQDLKSHPDSLNSWWNAALAYSMLARHKEAVEAIGKCIALSREHTETAPVPVRISQAWVYARSGDRKKALDIMREIGNSRERESLGTGYDFYMAYVLAADGEPNDHEEAFRYLERSVAEPHPFSATYNIEPGFDPLRSDPRFKEIIGKAGFPISLGQSMKGK